MLNVRDLKIGDNVGTKTISAIRYMDGQSGRPLHYIKSAHLPTAVAVEVTFNDGTTTVEHPGSIVA